MKLVIAQNWQAFEWYCKQSGEDPGDRLRTIPLIQYSDKHRINRRVCRGAKIVRVGKIDSELYKTFKQQLKKFGLEVTE